MLLLLNSIFKCSTFEQFIPKLKRQMLFLLTFIFVFLKKRCLSKLVPQLEKKRPQNVAIFEPFWDSAGEQVCPTRRHPQVGPGHLAGSRKRALFDLQSSFKLSYAPDCVRNRSKLSSSFDGQVESLWVQKKIDKTKLLGKDRLLNPCG